MATAHIKKIIRIGGSLAIILPTQWAKGKVQAGTEMVVVANGDLRIFPILQKDKWSEHDEENPSTPKSNGHKH